MKRRVLSDLAPAERDRVSTELHFTDGAVIVPSNCPKNIPARRHWNADGSACLCPPGEPERKVVTTR